MKQDTQKVDLFLQEEGLLDTIDEQRIFRAVQSKSVPRKSKRLKKWVTLMVASFLILTLVGFTTVPYLSKIINTYFGHNFSTLLTPQEEISVTKNGVKIRLLQYFQDNGVYYTVISTEGTEQKVLIDPADVPGVSVIKEITPEKEHRKQFFLLTSFDKLSELAIMLLQTNPVKIKEEIKLSSIEERAANQSEQISRSAILSSTGIEEANDPLLILKGEHRSTDDYFAISSYGMIQDRFHVQIQSLNKSINDLLLSANTDTEAAYQPTVTYLFDYYQGANKTYRKEFVFDIDELDKVDAFTISGTLFTEQISADWTIDMGDPDPLPTKVFESTDKAVSVTVSPLSVHIQTPYTTRLAGSSVIAEDSEGNKQELAILNPQDQQGTNDMTYMTYYNDLSRIEKVYIGDEVFTLAVHR